MLQTKNDRYQNLELLQLIPAIRKANRPALQKVKLHGPSLYDVLPVTKPPGNLPGNWLGLITQV